MIQLWGAIFVIGGCTYLGLTKAQDLRQKVMVTQDFIQALSYMKREITQNHRMLPEIIKKLAEKKDNFVGEYFRILQNQWEEGNSFATKWEYSIQVDSFLPHVLGDLLEPLGCVLGQYDSFGQGEAISRLIEELIQLKEEQQQESQRLGKVYGVMGVTFGLFLVILLL